MRELRFDPIRNRWVIISTERARRPNDYIVAGERGDDKPEKNVAACPFCEGSEGKTPSEIFAVRVNGSGPNSPGWRVRVVPNKFPALQIEDNTFRYAMGIFDVVSGAGAHEVIIETPDHDKGLADLDVGWIKDVLLCFRERIKDLLHDNRLRYILIFKNHKEKAGASLMHTHSQLIATPIVPPILKQELAVCRENYRSKERCLICDLIKQETDFRERIVYETERYMIWAPFASSFPFETWILPKKHQHDYSLLDDRELRELAFVMRLNLLSLKNLLNDPPYNFVLHTSPPEFDRPGRPDYWDSIELDYHWHMEFVPRLTTIAGFEWGAGFFINPTPPEIAAGYLKEEIVNNLNEVNEDDGYIDR
ncbi:MAG TPA: galactose-1-phosphate uridylyltransferase [Thermodesulfobacteriota bacterium]|nr:galactose-1-phosphate uridylyltransferase [Thermodesulfobacteriota bacterium]